MAEPVAAAGLRLAVGTLTAVPIRPPLHVDQRVGRSAALWSIPAVLPVAAVAAGVSWCGTAINLMPWLTAVAVIAAIAWTTRAIHLDGLADTADGLSSSFDRDRALAVMRTGDVGPSGVVVLVLMLTAQIACIAAMSTVPWSPAAIFLLVCASRVAVPLACHRAIPAARPDGLGAVMAGTVPTAGLGGALVLATALLVTAAIAVQEPWWRGAVAAAAMVAVTALLIWHAVRRLGGITGDVIGASIETALLSALVVLAA